MNRKRVQAFTIMEVTITMLVAAILIGITYTTYTIVSRSYLSFKAKNDGMAVLERLDELLKKDFDRSEIVLKDTSGLSFKIKNDLVKYTITPDYIIRVSAVTDTFKVKNEGVRLLFDQVPIDDLNINEEKNRLDELDLTVLYQDEKIAYHYHKIYSSADLINRNPDALH